MLTSSDLRKGLRLELDGQPYVITEFNFQKPGKGAAIYNCKLKNLIDGSTLSKSYRSNDKFKAPEVEQRQVVYSYEDGNMSVFMDENYEQVSVEQGVLGDQRYFLAEDMEVELLLFNGRPLGVDLPTFVEKAIVKTEPGIRGDTATNVTKSAQISGGYTIEVPLFINQGDVVIIDTRTGEYSERARSTKD